LLPANSYVGIKAVRTLFKAVQVKEIIYIPIAATAQLG